MGSSFGKVLVLTTFGESHGEAVGGILDGFPANVAVDQEYLQSELDRRRPGGGIFSTTRREEDTIHILSGIFNGRSTGAPIAFLCRNKDIQPQDYDHLKEVYRPSHADFTFEKKYGMRDHRGGGRSSARETVARVAGGAFVKLWLNSRGITFHTSIDRIGTFTFGKDCTGLNDPLLVSFLEDLKNAGDTIGGVISGTISGVPAGLGEPVFDKLGADLAKAMLSINAVKGFEIGSGFSSSAMKGSEHNDPFFSVNGRIRTITNNSGGIQGGISNGMDITFKVAFKPVSTLMMDQKTVNRSGEEVVLKGVGRHDVCVVPRALPVVEAMAALVIGDHLVRNLRS